MPKEMDGFELRSIMHKLQLSRFRIAEILEIDIKTVFLWESNKQTPPESATAKLRQLMDNKRQRKKKLI